MASPKIPDNKSSPAQVRSYLKHVLKVKHDIPDQEAEEVAARWRYGRGRDFGSSNSGAYEKIFGAELGPCLYRSVCDEGWEEWRSRWPGSTYYYGAFGGLAVLIYTISDVFHSLDSFSDSVFRLSSLVSLNFLLHLSYGSTINPNGCDTVAVCGIVFFIFSIFGWFLWLLSLTI